MHRGRLLAAGTLAQLREGVQAEVRLRLKVRHCASAQVLALLPGSVRCDERGDTSLTLYVAMQAKMQALRAIAQAGDLIQDVEVAAPGLQELYGHVVGAAEEAQ
jgi:hypothetical protein